MTINKMTGKKSLEEKSRVNIKKQSLISIATILLAFNGWGFIQAGENVDQQVEEAPMLQDENMRGSEGSHKGRPRRGRMPISRFLDILDVNEDQRDSVREILREERSQMHALHSGVEDQADAERTATMTETREGLSAVLSDDQLAKYDEMIERRKLARHKRHPQPDVL